MPLSLQYIIDHLNYMVVLSVLLSDLESPMLLKYNISMPLYLTESAAQQILWFYMELACLLPPDVFEMVVAMGVAISAMPGTWRRQACCAIMNDRRHTSATLFGI